jgi:hypothetical protein
MATNIHFLAYCGLSLAVLKELNAIVQEPYMVSSVEWTQRQLDSKYVCAQLGRAIPCSPSSGLLCRGFRDMGSKDNYAPRIVRICRASKER